MTIKPPTTEELLESGRTVVLSETERSRMKSELLSYATQQSILTAVPVPSPYLPFVWLRSGAIALMVIMVSSVGYAAHVSLPGDPLYSVKVDIIEPAVGLARFDEADRLSYQVSLLERRLSEVEALSAEEVMSDDEEAQIEDQVAVHIAAIEQVLTADTDRSIARPFALRNVADAAAITEAHERLLDGLSALATEESEIAEANDAIADRYQEELEAFVAAEQAEVVATYLEDVLDDIALSLGSSSTASSSLKVVTELIEDAEIALSKGALDDALAIAGSAEKRLDVDTYVDAVLHERLDTVLDEE